MNTPQYEKSKTPTGIHIKATTTKVPAGSWRYLVMGPTGAGKSNFIESLAAKSQNLCISKDQLSSYTQSVSAYQVVNFENVSSNTPLYLIDVPGFSDTRISEIEVMDMIRHWLKENDLQFVDRILYLIPITEPRMPGSKRRTIEMLKVFLEPSRDLDSVIFVTTMWDTLDNDRSRQRAEGRFTQLREEILKEFISDGGKITQFTNTLPSALQILNTGLDGQVTNVFSHTTSTPSTYLYQDLHSRIEGLLFRQQCIEAELSLLEPEFDAELKMILQDDKKENEEMLFKFLRQFHDFGLPPPGFEDAHKQLLMAVGNTQPTPNDIQQTRLVGLNDVKRRLIETPKRKGFKSSNGSNRYIFLPTGFSGQNVQWVFNPGPY